MNIIIIIWPKITSSGHAQVELEVEKKLAAMDKLVKLSVLSVLLFICEAKGKINH